MRSRRERDHGRELPVLGRRNAVTVRPERGIGPPIRQQPHQELRRAGRDHVLVPDEDDPPVGVDDHVLDHNAVVDERDAIRAERLVPLTRCRTPLHEDVGVPRGGPGPAGDHHIAIGLHGDGVGLVAGRTIDDDRPTAVPLGIEIDRRTIRSRHADACQEERDEEDDDDRSRTGPSHDRSSSPKPAVAPASHLPSGAVRVVPSRFVLSRPASERQCPP